MGKGTPKKGGNGRGNTLLQRGFFQGKLKIFQSAVKRSHMNLYMNLFSLHSGRLCMKCMSLHLETLRLNLRSNSWMFLYMLLGLGISVP